MTLPELAQEVIEVFVRDQQVRHTPFPHVRMAIEQLLAENECQVRLDERNRIWAELPQDVVKALEAQKGNL